MRQFQEDESVPFFVLSLKAGGAGLNLTAASHVIHFDRWWNPAVENQATDRAFRIGQTKNVLVHKFVCRGTVEEKIDQMIEAKQQLAGDLLGGGAEMLLTEMKDDELLEARGARSRGGDEGGLTDELVRMAATTCRWPSGGGRPRSKLAEAQEEGAIDCAGDDRGPHDRQDLLGQVVVRQPRTLQRLSRTACRAAAPMSATAPSSTCRSPRARSRRWSAAPSSTRSRSPSRRSRRRAGRRSAGIARARIDSLVELLQGRLAKGVMDRVCREGDGLFPAPSEIKLSCSCPDWADMCKHVAAVLYGVGARLDEKPELLFVLRGVDENELLASAGQDLSLTKAAPATAQGARRRRCRRPVRAGDGRARESGRGHRRERAQSHRDVEWRQGAGESQSGFREQASGREEGQHPGSSAGQIRGKAANADGQARAGTLDDPPHLLAAIDGTHDAA